MKIRNGFVSNSSSSSFVINFPKFPTTRDELAEIMGDCGANCGYGQDRNTEQVIDRVWEDIKDTKPVGDNFIEMLRINDMDWDNNNDLIDVIAGPEFRKEIQERNRDEDTLSIDRVIEMVTTNLNKLKTQYEGSHSIVLEYSDDSDADLEHGDIFRNIDHTRYSHH